MGGVLIRFAEEGRAAMVAKFSSLLKGTLALLIQTLQMTKKLFLTRTKTTNVVAKKIKE